MVDCLPTMTEAMGSIPSVPETKSKTNKQRIKTPDKQMSEYRLL